MVRTNIEPLTVEGYQSIEVVALDWDRFIAWFSTKWKQGQHVAIVGPTGKGKTTIIGQILRTRRYVLALDPKGGDGTLSKLENHGFERIPWPPTKETRKGIEEGKPARLLVGRKVSTVSDFVTLRRQLRQALVDAFNEGGWTVYVDELQLAADKRFMNLGASIELILIAARDRGVSMVSSYQRPANVPRSASEMSRWFMVLYTRDRDVADRLAEMAGRPAAEMRGFLRGLPDFVVLLFSDDPRQPVIVTRAPLL